MESAATAGTTQRDGGVVWEVAGKPVSVRLSLDVVGRLCMAVREGFKALPRRGLETGGLLIGTRKKAGNRVIVDIGDFEAVESEHAAGPSYLLSETDRRLLEARITAHRAARTERCVVGFYRSHTRSGFAMTMEDSYLYSTYFREASDVFLLIKSNEGSPPTGGFIIREGGKILADTPYAQFPFSLNFAMLPHAGEARAEALPVSPLPQVDFPTISVSAGLPGASPETMASSVATPLERQFSTIPGLDSMTSTSSRGSTSVTLQFSLERSLDSAAQDVQSSIAAALRRRDIRSHQ
jgi:hypothetical protein